MTIIQETPHNAWAFHLARLCFGEETNPILKVYFLILMQWLEGCLERNEMRYVDKIRARMNEIDLNEKNPFFEPDEAKREMLIRDYAEQILKKEKTRWEFH